MITHIELKLPIPVEAGMGRKTMRGNLRLGQENLAELSGPTGLIL
jgi:hypothetical protein